MYEDKIKRVHLLVSNIHIVLMRILNSNWIRALISRSAYSYSIRNPDSYDTYDTYDKTICLYLNVYLKLNVLTINNKHDIHICAHLIFNLSRAMQCITSEMRRNFERNTLLEKQNSEKVQQKSVPEMTDQSLVLLSQWEIDRKIMISRRGLIKTFWKVIRFVYM